MSHEPENVRRDWRIPDQLWERIQPLLPPRKAHPLGCHRPRVEDRRAMDAIFFVLRTGCQWNALQDTGLCASSSAHRRFQEWAAAGVFQAFWAQGLAAYAALQGLDWEWLAMDGAMTKAPLGGGNRWASIRPTAGRSGPSGACSPTAAACLSASPWRARTAMTSRWSRPPS
jgi:transposase